MCLAIPGLITSVKQEGDVLFRSGEVSFDGVRREINLAALPEARVGDYVLVHVGMGIALIDEEEALKTLALFKEMEGGPITEDTL